MRRHSRQSPTSQHVQYQLQHVEAVNEDIVGQRTIVNYGEPIAQSHAVFDREAGGRQHNNIFVKGSEYKQRKVVILVVFVRVNGARTPLRGYVGPTSDRPLASEPPYLPRHTFAP